MKHQPIHTKYHKIQGARMLLSIGGKAADSQDFFFGVNADKLFDLIKAAQHLPRYVIYSDLVEMLNDRDGAMQKSLATMINSGLGHLPYHSVLVEFDQEADIDNGKGEHRSTRVRHFVALSEEEPKGPDEDRFVAMPFSYLEDSHTLVVSPIIAGATMVTEAQAIRQGLINGFPVSGNGSGVMFRAVLAPYINHQVFSREQRDLMVQKSIEHSMLPVSKALCALTVLLGTKGIDREAIKVDAKLNRSREKSGKQMISDHTVVRIGHVYSRSGDRVKYNYGCPGHSMPVHWRAGHVRRQRYGTGLDKSYDLWIEPMLINYIEGEAKPSPKIKELTK